MILIRCPTFNSWKEKRGCDCTKLDDIMTRQWLLDNVNTRLKAKKAAPKKSTQLYRQSKWISQKIQAGRRLTEALAETDNYEPKILQAEGRLKLIENVSQRSNTPDYGIRTSVKKKKRMYPPLHHIYTYGAAFNAGGDAGVGVFSANFLICKSDGWLATTF